MSKLHLTLVQEDLIWEEPDKNMQKFAEKLKALHNKTDVVILPEMFTTGFSMSPQSCAEEWPGKTLEWMKNESVKGDFALCGSIMAKTGAGYFNRFVWADPQGNVEYYDKRHLFQMGGEHEIYQAGNALLSINYKDWRIAPFICYDLRFPVWSRNVNNYDLAIYVANWPAPRYQVWEKLLLARAIENQCFVAGVNCVGVDGRNIKYSGNSMIVDPRGNAALSFTPGISEIKSLEISKDELLAFRKKFPVLTDADKFRLEGL